MVLQLKLESPSPKDALCQVWLKLAQWFWRMRWKCEKFTDGRTDRWTDRQTTDNRWSEKLSAQLFMRNKYTCTVFTMGGTVALRSINKKFSGKLQFCSYLLRRKSCARFGLNFFLLWLCQVQIPDEKNTRHVSGRLWLIKWSWGLFIFFPNR